MPTARSVCEKWRKRIVKREIPEALAEACHVLKSKVEANAPEAKGELKDGIGVTKLVTSGTAIEQGVFVDSDHALANEYGNAEMTAQPFFRPAIRSEVPKMKRILQRITKP